MNKKFFKIAIILFVAFSLFFTGLSSFITKASPDQMVITESTSADWEDNYEMINLKTDGDDLVLIKLPNTYQGFEDDDKTNWHADNQISTVRAKEGNKSLLHPNTLSGGYSNSNIVGEKATFDFWIYIPAGQNRRSYITNGVLRYINGSLQSYDGSSYVTFASYNEDAWNHIKITNSLPGQKYYDIEVNGVKYQPESRYDPGGNPMSSLNFSAEGSNVWIDEFRHYGYYGGAEGMGYRISPALSLDVIENVESSLIEWDDASPDFGSALEFDGTDDWVDIGNLGNPGQGTIVLWFSKDNTNTQYLLDGRITGNWWLLTHYNGHDINFLNKVVYDGTSPNTWYHVAVTADSGETKMYVNGELVDTGEGLSIDFRSVRMATRYTNANYLSGKLDDVRVYNQALTESEIQETMYTELTGNEIDLIGYWKFNAGSGTTANDSSGNNNHGTIYGSTWTEGIQTDIVIKNAVTEDGNSSPIIGSAEWQIATSGESIPGIIEGDNLTGKYLWVKQELSTEALLYTPSLHSLTTTIDFAYVLEVSKTGTGSGTVTSSPTGIDCGETCSFAFDPGTGVTLTAEADPDHNFVGWSGGGCTGTGDCVLTMDSNKSVTAEFSVPPCQKHNVGGWTWSENIGWVSFSCQNENAIGEGVDYGVDIDESTGVLSGQAWSENIGWISFDLSETGPPPAEPDYSSSGYIAKLDTSNYELSGWARAMSASSTENGEWNGWIKLSWNTSSETGSVSLNGSSKEFEGYAWGGNESDVDSKGVIGWISFNDKDYDSSPGLVDYQVTTTMSFGPTVSDLSASYPSYCDQSRIPKLSWNVSGADPNYDYEVRFCSEDGCGGTGDPIFSESAQDTSSTQWAPTCSYCCDTSSPSNYNSLLWGNTYYYQVRVSKAGEGNWSSWTTGTEGFTTPDHCYPFSYFVCSYDGEDWYDCDQDDPDNKCDATTECLGPIPYMPPAGEKIYVKDVSTCHNPDDTSFDAVYCSEDGYDEVSCPTSTVTTYYSWDFVNATSSDGTEDFASSTIEILETGEWGISVTTTDTHSPDQSCGHEEGGQSGLPLPDWMEISPY